MLMLHKKSFFLTEQFNLASILQIKQQIFN